MLNRGSLERGTSELGDEVRHWRGDIDKQTVGEYTNDERRDRFADGHYNMVAFCADMIAVGFELDRAMSDDEEAIRPRIVEEMPDRPSCPLWRLKLYVADVDGILRQLPDRPTTAADGRGRDHLARVLEAPAVVRCLLPVVECNTTRGRWRKSDHDAGLCAGGERRQLIRPHIRIVVTTRRSVKGTLVFGEPSRVL